MVSRQSRQERTRHLALRAAELFAERGYTSTSMADVAAAAGASKETLYAYFGNKAGLLRAALTILIHPQQDGSEPTASSSNSPADAQDELTLFLTSLVGRLMQPSYLALARIVVGEVPRDPSLGDLFRSAVAEPAIRAAAAVVERDDRSFVGVVDSEAAGRLLIGSVLTYVLLDGLLRSPADVVLPGDEVIARLVTTFRQTRDFQGG
ncbi:TetR/AcrR family transcriptional regulator [Microlunatus flavus]|uniref:DNA-binding transcriptional regulator, AcrR family n=1 Tax=Microlunatus flavus TaxID=1036181 RepID=A0A1H9JL76_9ACTN|nr:TetR/AcrR family transcriptional regulator [Microlunatus flavus]SEQ87523.1 DNA-binding transcriptional regulator, AcrR family [Microlunatus flavus]